MPQDVEILNELRNGKLRNVYEVVYSYLKYPNRNMMNHILVYNAISHLFNKKRLDGDSDEKKADSFINIILEYMVSTQTVDSTDFPVKGEYQWEKISLTDWDRRKIFKETNERVWELMKNGGSFQENLENYLLSRMADPELRSDNEKSDTELIKILYDNFDTYYTKFYDNTKLESVYGLYLDSYFSSYFKTDKIAYEKDLPINLQSGKYIKWKIDNKGNQYLDGMHALGYTIDKQGNIQYQLFSIHIRENIGRLEIESGWHLGYLEKKGYEAIPSILVTDGDGFKLEGRVKIDNKEIIDLGPYWFENPVIRPLIESNKLKLLGKRTYGFQIVDVMFDEYGSIYNIYRTTTHIVNPALQFNVELK